MCHAMPTLLPVTIITCGIMLLTSSLADRNHSLAIVTLASGKRPELLHRSLSLIEKHVLPSNKGDVIVFHTGAFDHISAVLSLSTLSFVHVHRVPRVSWSLPRHLHAKDFPSWKHSCCKGIGYRHMCRWFSNDMFKYLFALGYSWVMRVDEDSEIRSDLVDVVSGMSQTGSKYGFRGTDKDIPDVTYALPELTSYFLTANRIKPARLFQYCNPPDITGLNSRGGWNMTIIYNNFFVANITWWLSKQVQDYLQLVDRSNGHYLFRWGDAPVHTMVVLMFLKDYEVKQFDFEYRHAFYYPKGSKEPAL